MNKKLIYRIEMKIPDSLINELVLLAALSNGGQYISLMELQAVARTICIKNPFNGKGITITPIGDNVLSIDKGLENILLLTEVEITELEFPDLTEQEARDILNELNPVLMRGINNPDSHENLI